jgi:hypothetical protein
VHSFWSPPRRDALCAMYALFVVLGRGGWVGETERLAGKSGGFGRGRLTKRTVYRGNGDGSLY